MKDKYPGAYDRTLNLLGRFCASLFGFVDNVRMFKVGNFITLCTLVLLATGFGATAMAFKSVAAIASVWREFDSGLARRIDLLGHFQHYLGHGGVARQWSAARNGDASAQQAVTQALLKTREGFPAFLNAGPSEKEKGYLAVLENTVSLYEKALAGGQISGEEEAAATSALAGIKLALADQRKSGADAVENAIWSLSIKVGGIMFAVGVILAVFGLFAFWFIRYRVALPLGAINATMSRLSSGNTVVDVPFVAKSDEVGEMARAVQVFKDNAIVKNRMEIQKQEVARNIQATTLELTELIRRAREATTLQAEAASSMSSATEELSVSIDKVADNAQGALSATRETVTAVGEGERQVRATIATMGGTAKLVADSAEKMGHLAQQSERIQEIVTIIQGIAKQTDLLALNASIEAARAGSAGYSFAVVADQVRELSEKTNTSARDISIILTRIQQLTCAVTADINNASNMASSSAENSLAIGAALEEALASIDTRARMVEQAMADIADSAREQSMAGREIAQKVETVASSSETVNRQINRIDELAMGLRGSVTSI